MDTEQLDIYILAQYPIFEELVPLAPVYMCRVIKRTILLIVQKLAVLKVGPINITGSTKRG